MSFFFSSRSRHTRFDCDWSSDVCSSDLRGRASQLAVFDHQCPRLEYVARRREHLRPVRLVRVDRHVRVRPGREMPLAREAEQPRSEEHTSELQSQSNLVCRLLLEKKKK